MADREEEKIRGQQAKELLENPIFKEAVQKVSEELDLEWISSPVRDTEGREKIYMMKRMLNVLLVQIKSVVETGQLATKQTDKQEL
tara:strand:- start:10066 stop:10323 length:258 start_codon:yes stop_codon:yes gene_type:complete